MQNDKLANWLERLLYRMIRALARLLLRLPATRAQRDARLLLASVADDVVQGRS